MFLRLSQTCVDQGLVLELLVVPHLCKFTNVLETLVQVEGDCNAGDVMEDLRLLL